MTENVSQKSNEREIEEEEHKIFIYFLQDDEDQSVHVEEVEQIDFLEVIKHLNSGGSVFITLRRPTHNITSRQVSLNGDLEELKKPWYFVHI
jgi:hypothetical protein